MSSRSRRAAALIGAAALVAVALGGGVDGTFAAFTDQSTVTAGSTPSTAFTSGSVATPAMPNVVQSTTTTPPGQAVVSWGATTVTTGGGNTTATSYDVLRYPTAAGGTATPVCSAVATLTCTVPKVAGTSYYAVRARFQTNWIREGTRRTHTPDTTGPTSNINPDPYSCNNGVACGTATDSGGGTVAKVEYNLLRTRTRPGNPTLYYCWSGSAWITVGTASCAWADATGTTSWWIPGNLNTAFAPPPGGFMYTYTGTVRATDSYGNLGPNDVEIQSQ